MAIALRGELGWQHQYGKLERKTQLMFKRTDAAFDVNSVPVSRDGAVLKAGIDVAVNKTPSCPSATAGSCRPTTGQQRQRRPDSALLIAFTPFDLTQPPSQRWGLFSVPSLRQSDPGADISG